MTVSPDTEPPTVTTDSPIAAQVLLVGDDLVAKVTTSDNVGIASLEFALDGQIVSARRKSLQEWVVANLPTRGPHTLAVVARDHAGLASVPLTTQFRVAAFAVSRELSAFNIGPQDRPFALSREVSLFNIGPVDKPQALSREVSLENKTP